MSFLILISDANITPLARTVMNVYHFIMIFHGVEQRQRMLMNANVSKILSNFITYLN